MLKYSPIPTKSNWTFNSIAIISILYIDAAYYLYFNITEHCTLQMEWYFFPSSSIDGKFYYEKLKLVFLDFYEVRERERARKKKLIFIISYVRMDDMIHRRISYWSIAILNKFALHCCCIREHFSNQIILEKIPFNFAVNFVAKWTFCQKSNFHAETWNWKPIISAAVLSCHVIRTYGNILHYTILLCQTQTTFYHISQIRMHYRFRTENAADKKKKTTIFSWVSNSIQSSKK